MALVIRRYVAVGPTTANLAKFVATGIDTPTIVAQYGESIVDLQYDNAIPGLVEDLDAYMAGINLIPSATASPKQVFEYAANGAEGASVVIGAGQGFVPRVTANYVVQLTICKPNGNAFKIYNIRDGSKTINDFIVDVNVPMEAGDMLCFTVEDKT